MWRRNSGAMDVLEEKRTPSTMVGGGEGREGEGGGDVGTHDGGDGEGGVAKRGGDGGGGGGGGTMMALLTRKEASVAWKDTSLKPMFGYGTALYFVEQVACSLFVADRLYIVYRLVF